MLGAEGWVFQETGLDFHYLAPWLMAGAILLLASIVVSGTRSRLRRSNKTEEGGNALRRWTSVTLPVAPSLLAGSGWSVLLLGLVAAVAHLPAAISGRPGGPDLSRLNPYLEIFDSLLPWAIAALTLIAVARSSRAVWPALGEVFGFPWQRLLALAAAYVLLADGGVLSVAFDFSDSRILAVLALGLGLPYLASVLRRISREPLSRRVRLPVRAALLLADCGWLALLVGVVAALPGVADGIPNGRFGAGFDVVMPYLEVLDTLAFWAIVLIGPFIVIRAVAAFWPTVGIVFGFPLVRLILFAAALALFSDDGVLATAFEFSGSVLMFVLTLALGLSYLASVLRGVAGVPLPGRIGPSAANILPLAGLLARAVSLAMVVWVSLNYLPVINALLLDRRLTHGTGQDYMPIFGRLFEVRYAAAGCCFALVLTVGLSDLPWTPARWHIRPLLAAIGFAAIGLYGLDDRGESLVHGSRLSPGRGNGPASA